MKIMKRLSVFLAFLLIFSILAGCTDAPISNTETPSVDYSGSTNGGAGSGSASGGPSYDVGDSGVLYPGTDGGAAGGTDESFGSDVSVPSKPIITAGLLTASEWNDNKYFDQYAALFASKTENDDAGKFASFVENHWGFHILDRVTVYVEKNDAPVAGATVACKNADGAAVFYARTGADGMAYIFPNADSGTVTVASGEATAETTFDKDNRTLTVSLDGNTEVKRNKIQMMFVIDITGSMSDEHNYLKTELTDVISRIAAFDTQTEIELALLFYRDTGDKEKFAYHDFTEVTNETGLDKMLAHLASQNASGGGDYPEAVDEALDLAVSKGWDDDSTTKLIFHLLDAPAHDKEAHQQLYSSAVLAAADKGIRICPILASGANLLCEYIVRQAAVYTGGSFIYITDHSGIGGGHLDPDIPNAVVEKLNDLLVRVVRGYHTGTFAEPVPWDKAQASQ